MFADWAAVFLYLLSLDAGDRYPSVFDQLIKEWRALALHGEHGNRPTCPGEGHIEQATLLSMEVVIPLWHDQTEDLIVTFEIWKTPYNEPRQDDVVSFISL